MSKRYLLAAVGLAALAASPAEALSGVNGVALNGVALNGVALNGTQAQDAAGRAEPGTSLKAVRLSLPDGTEMTFR